MPTAEAFLGVLPFNIKSSGTPSSSPIPRRRNQSQGSSINDRFSRLFRHRSRVVTAEVDQERTRADRTRVTEFETEYLQQRSTELLLQEDYMVAKLLCRLEISGDRAATMASHLVSFLRGSPQTSGRVEDFVIGAFDLHIANYATQTANPRNVLRDNNLATMLVVCYLQQTCRSYLVSILQPVMSAIEPFVENCELDPMRLPEDHGVGTTSRNSYNLYCVCRSVLDAVFSAGKHAPPEMRRLCTLIRGRIEATWDMSELSPGTSTPRSRLRTATSPVSAPALAISPASAATSTSPPVSAPTLDALDAKAKEQGGGRKFPILELNDWEDNLKSTVQVDIMNDIKATLDAWLDKSDNAGYGLDASGSLGAKGGEARKSLLSLLPSTFAEPSSVDTTLSVKGGKKAHKAKASRQSQTKPPEEPRLSDIKATWRQTHSPRKNKSPTMSSRFSKHTSKRYSGSYFTPVETVTSMLLFVRFFIPILTSPEAYGLVDVKMSPANRRGLLLCAKVLAVLCNGVSFGNKEPYLMSMNGLIREYRPKLRQFLNALSTGATDPSAPGKSDMADYICEESDSDDSDDDDGSDSGDSVTIDELASQFQVISVGAEIGTKEEQRKSRMSLANGALGGGGFQTPRAQDEEIPPVPELPPLPANPRQRSKPNLKSTKAAAAEADGALPPLRKTIDLPSHPPMPPRVRKMTGMVAVASTTSDSLQDNEIVDESLVTVDFLSCLAGNFPKFEALIDESARTTTQQQQQRLQAACRELKPIAQYAKNLKSPSKGGNVGFISRPSVCQDRARQQAPPPSRPYGLSRRISDEYEDLGHRRTKSQTDK